MHTHPKHPKQNTFKGVGGFLAIQKVKSGDPHSTQWNVVFPLINWRLLPKESKNTIMYWSGQFTDE